MKTKVGGGLFKNSNEYALVALGVGGAGKTRRGYSMVSRQGILENKSAKRAD